MAVTAPAGFRRPGPGLLALPLFLLVVAAFLLPLLLVLLTAVRDPELATTLPHTAAELQRWDGAGLPPEAAFALVAEELGAADRTQTIGALIRRLNFESPGIRSLLTRTARSEARSREALTALDPRWADPATWRLLHRAAGPWTDLYLLRALDLARGPDGAVTGVPPDQELFRAVLARTFGIGLVVTGVTLLFAYPVAASLARLRGWPHRIGLALVLMPFWISVLVRTTAWFVLLQREGPLNALLVATGLVDAPMQLMFTWFAVVLATSHVLLPFAILPLLAAMQRVDPALPMAARGLGAAPWQAFLRVRLPLELPGLLAGGGLVFLIAVGFWVTPALVGGPGDQMVGSFIADYVNETLNWGMAAALAVLLLLGTAALLLATWWPLRRVGVP